MKSLKTNKKLDLIDVLKRSTVKIESFNENTKSGSGVIYIPPNDKEYIYILTAKHCIDTKNEADVTILFKLDNSHDFISFPPTQIILSEHYDFCLLKVFKQTLPQKIKKVLLPEYRIQLLYKPTSILEHETCKCAFRGYPKAFDNDKAQRINIKLSELEYQGIKFEFSNLDGSNETMKSKDGVQGFSGSGIFAKANDQFYLVGIVTDTKSTNNAFRMFSGIDFSFLDKFFRENGLAEVSIKYNLEIQNQQIDFSKLLAQNSKKNKYQVLLEEAQRLERQGNIDIATLYYQEVLKSRKYKKRAYVNLFNLALEFQNKGEWEKAQKIYDGLKSQKKATEDLAKSNLQKKMYELEGDKQLNDIQDFLKISEQDLKLIYEKFLSAAKIKTSQVAICKIEVDNDKLEQKVNIVKCLYTAKGKLKISNKFIIYSSAFNISKYYPNYEKFNSRLKNIIDCCKEIQTKSRNQFRQRLLKGCVMIIIFLFCGWCWYIAKQQKEYNKNYRKHFAYLEEANAYANQNDTIGIIRSYTKALLKAPPKKYIEIKQMLKKIENEQLLKIQKKIQQGNVIYTKPLGNICKNSLQLIQMKSTGKFGYVNNQGEIVIYPKYDKAWEKKTKKEKQYCCFSNKIKQELTGAKVLIKDTDSNFESFYINEKDSCVFACETN